MHRVPNFIMTDMFLVVQTCDNLMVLGPDYMGVVGEVQIPAA
jgi:hypothetical protein